MKPMTARTANQRIKFDENQSSSWPLSSITCKQPIHRARNPIPKESNFPAGAFFKYGGSSRNRRHIKIAAMPTGILM